MPQQGNSNNEVDNASAEEGSSDVEITTTTAPLIPNTAPEVEAEATSLDGERIEDARLKDGCCPSCGTRLFKLKKKGWGKNRKTVRKPLNVEGEVARGQCVQCLTRNGQQLPNGQNNQNQTEQVHVEGYDAALVAATLAAATITETSSQQQQQQQEQQQKEKNSSAGNTVYIGGFNSSGERNGSGELLWSNGDRYVGNFLDGTRHGQGTLYFADGSEFVGTWAYNFMHGEGTRRFPNGDIYMGEYCDGKRSGVGRFYFANGDMYHGDWHDDKFHGFGRFYYSNGQRFEGTFCKSKRHGKGKLQRNDGSLDIYNYNNDVRIDPGVRWSANRKKAWRLSNGGKALKPITIDQAINIGENMEAENNLPTNFNAEHSMREVI